MNFAIKIYICQKLNLVFISHLQCGIWYQFAIILFFVQVNHSMTVIMDISFYTYD